ncbi:MAG: hypothetical protein HRU26_14565 [Psychroserpens sp.]|nr:hypothetical protein [Psychroserpens sp.]
MSLENAKPKILGSDTHAGGLTGDVISELTVNQSLPTVAAAMSCTSQAVNFTTIGVTGMTITEAKNKILLRGKAGFRMSSSNSMDVRIIRR